MSVGILMAYLVMRMFGSQFIFITEPVTLLVTFLHEFGHATAAILTGGHVYRMQINANGSGYTQTAGGIQSIVLMGGYIGSAVFRNLLFTAGSTKISKPLISILAACMIFAGLIWFNTLLSTTILCLFAVGLYLLRRFSSVLLMFLGMASVVYVIQDFNVGPSSDLAAYHDKVGVFPTEIWMYLWLAIVVMITATNVGLYYRLNIKKS